MFPPVEDAVLRSSPQFAALYTNLTSNKLNASGTSKQPTTELESATTAKVLREEQARHAKHHLLRKAIRDLDLTPPSSKSQKADTAHLPQELIELILLLSSHLNTPRLDASSERLIQNTEQWLPFADYLPQISTMISSHLQKRALLLARITSPTTNPSYLHRTTPKMVPIMSDLQTKILEQKEQLAARRIALVTHTLHVLEQHQNATSLAISHLEQTVHGALSRNLKAKAEYLAANALSVSLLVKEKEITAKKMIYTERVQKTLTNYMQHLRIEHERVGEKTREAERILWGYGVGRDDGGEKERVMKEIAKQYGKLKAEIRSVERDVGRLKGK